MIHEKEIITCHACKKKSTHVIREFDSVFCQACYDDMKENFLAPIVILSDEEIDGRKVCNVV